MTASISSFSLCRRHYFPVYDHDGVLLALDGAQAARLFSPDGLALAGGRHFEGIIHQETGQMVARIIKGELAGCPQAIDHAALQSGVH